MNSLFHKPFCKCRKVIRLISTSSPTRDVAPMRWESWVAICWPCTSTRFVWTGYLHLLVAVYCSVYSIELHTLSAKTMWAHTSTHVTSSKYLLADGACSRSACGRRCSRPIQRTAAMCTWDASWLHCTRRLRGRCGARRSRGSSSCAAPDTEACVLSTLR